MNNSSRLYLIVAILFTSLLSSNSTTAQNTLNLAGLSASSPSTVAYSLRRLSSSYSGNLIQVRRSSDNTTTNISYDGSGHLDTNALKAFVGAGNGFVSIWYDQSGNANNATQATTGSQPQIVSAGVILRSNSRPTVRFDGNTFIDGGSSIYSITNARSLNAVYNLQSGTASHIIDRSVAGTPVYSIKGDNSGQIRNDAGIIINTAGTSQSAPFTNTFTMIWDGSNNINMFKNGINDFSGSLSLPCTMDIMRIGRHFNNVGTYELNMWEVILFPSAISNGERQSMECNQQVYYSSIGIAGSRVLTTGIPTTLSANIAGGTWSSGNTGVATVNSSTGRVTGVATGTAIISYNTAAGCAIPTTITVSTPANALHFNGTDDIVTVANNSSLNISGNITIEAWINVSSTANGTQNVISKSNNINNNAYIFPRTDNNWSAIIGYLHIGGSWRTIAASYPIPAVGTWHHCAITYDGSRITLYIDGAVANFIFVSGALTTNTNALVMGSQPGYGEFFTGALDEARIWNVARTQAQIQADMNNDVAQQAGLVAYYRFNQGTASGTNTGLTAITDFSGSENCGTSSGFSLSGATSNFVAGAVGGYTNVNVVSPITGTLSVCSGSTTTLSSTTAGGVWSSSNTGVATVAAGVVTGVAAGTATISYTLCSFTVTAVVTVIAQPAAITGNNLLSTAINTNLANTVAGGTWSSSNTGVATIGSSTGVVTGVAAGTSSITYTTGTSCISTIVVTVNTPATGIHFDGTNDYISNTSGTNLPTGNSQYTIEAWIRPTSGVGGIVGWGNYGTNNQVNAFRLDGTNRLHNYWWFNDLTATVPSLTDGKWHHVAATFNGTTRSIYCDGVLYAQDNPTGHNVTVSNNLTIGRTWTSEYFPGSIDEVKIWNTGRTASQIIADMNCDVAQNPNLVAYYRLNEGVANGSNAANTSATDYSGNNNCGTLNGFALTGTTSNYITGAVGNCNTILPWLIPLLARLQFVRHLPLR